MIQEIPRHVIAAALEDPPHCCVDDQAVLLTPCAFAGLAPTEGPNAVRLAVSAADTAQSRYARFLHVYAVATTGALQNDVGGRLTHFNQAVTRSALPAYVSHGSDPT